MKLSYTGQTPIKGTANSACYDLVAKSVKLSDCGNKLIVGLGFRTSFSPKYEAELLSRSSIYKKDLVMANGKGVIDSDFRKEWMAIFYILNKKEGEDVTKRIEIGERVVQFKMNEVIQTDLEAYDEELFDTVFAETTRTGGFGSTGLH